MYMLHKGSSWDKKGMRKNQRGIKSSSNFTNKTKLIHKKLYYIAVNSKYKSHGSIF